MKRRYINNIIYVITISAVFLAAVPVNTYAADTDEGYDPVIVVSLGDSYSSGEGVEPFYGQYKDNNINNEENSIANKVNDPDWLAHRSMESWPGKLTIQASKLNEYKVSTDIQGDFINLNKNQDIYWFFMAVSGATTSNLKNYQAKTYDRGGLENAAVLKPQIDVFDSINKEFGANSVDYVTFTFGGNDVGFSKVIETAVLDSSYWTDFQNAKRCSDFGNMVKSAVYESVSQSDYLQPSKLTSLLNQTWDKFYLTTKSDIKKAYINVSQKAGDNAAIIVAGYPKLLDKTGNGIFFSKDEATQINNSVTRFNLELENLVSQTKQTGIDIRFASVEEAFDGHEAYSHDPYINGLELIKSQDLNDAFIGASDYSMHPNKTGTDIYARCVQEKIYEIENEKQNQKNDSPSNSRSNERSATAEEISAHPLKHYGFALGPEGVVLKLLDAAESNEYQTMIDCLSPEANIQANIVTGAISFVSELFTGEYLDWNNIVPKGEGITNLEKIDIQTAYITEDTDFALTDFSSKIPFLQNYICSQATVRVKYRYSYNNELKVSEDEFDVRRYPGYGWRVYVNWGEVFRK